MPVFARIFARPYLSLRLMNAPHAVAWTIDDATVEEVLVAKYLGVQIRVRGHNLVGL